MIWTVPNKLENIYPGSNARGSIWMVLMLIAGPLIFALYDLPTGRSKKAQEENIFLFMKVGCISLGIVMVLSLFRSFAAPLDQ